MANASVLYLHRWNLFMWLIISVVADLINAAPSAKLIESSGKSTHAHHKIVIQVKVSKDSNNTCTIYDAQVYSDEFQHCFKKKKFGDGTKDLDNMIPSVLEYSRMCAENVTKECNPNYESFMVIINRVISQIKDYSSEYLESITRGENNITDLDCIQKSLSDETYKSCFKEVFAGGTKASEEKFQQKVQKAISCSDKSHKLCSNATKTSLNRLVSTILGVKLLENEDMENHIKQPQKDETDYVKQPEKENVKNDFKQQEKEGVKDYVKLQEKDDKQTEKDNVKQPDKDQLKDDIKQSDKEYKKEVKQTQEESIKDSVKEPEKEGVKDDVKHSEKEISKSDIKQPEKEVIKDDVKQSEKEIGKGDIKQPEKEGIKDDAKQPDKKDEKEDVKQLEEGGIKDYGKQSEKADIKDDIKQPEKEGTEDAAKQTGRNDKQHIIIMNNPDHHHPRDEVKSEPPKPQPREEVKPEPQKPWRWYDYIIQPVLSVWRAVRWFFGF